MAKYTIEIRTLLEDENFNYFNFDYDFYTDDLKLRENFEKKYLENYFFSEIGQETVLRHKQMVKAKLNVIMDKYTQLYITQLKALNIDFLLNKDLKEEFFREIKKDEKGTALNDNSSNSDNSSTNNLSIDNKSSSMDDGNASINLDSGSLTNVSNTINSSDLKEVSKNITNNNTEVENLTNENEKTTLISKGNIGITSSADLLTKWRNTIINIDELIINECENLFMLIY